MEQQSAQRAGAAIGAQIFSIFGSAWLITWSIKSFEVNPLAIGIIVILGLSIFFKAWQQYKQNQAAHAVESETPEAKRGAKIFNIVNAAQGVGILIAVNVTENLGHKEWFIPSLFSLSVRTLFRSQRSSKIAVIT